MFLTTVSRSSTLPISLAQMKLHLNFNLPDYDSLITSYILAATAYLENRTATNLVTTTLIQKQDTFLRRYQRLNYYWGDWSYWYMNYRPQIVRLLGSPLQSVTSVSYYDTSNTLQTLTSGTDFTVLTPTNLPGFIEPLNGVSWPGTYNRSDAVQIEFVSGYSVIPENLLHVLRLLVQLWWDEKADASTDLMNHIPHGIECLLGQMDNRITL